MFFLMDIDVMQTSRLRPRICRSAMVDKQPGRDGLREILALCSSPSKLENVFRARSGVYPQ